MERAIKSLGGTLEAFYYAFGGTDLFMVADMPDNMSAANFSLLITSSGASRVKTIVLMTPEEIDQATKKTLDYRPPGQ